MAAKGIETRVATGDGDTYIGRCGLEKATFLPIVAITGQDVDSVVLLITLAPQESNIYFTKLGNGKVEAKLFSTRKLRKELPFPQTIVLLHVFSGCDITLAIYRKKQSTIITLFKNQLSQMKNIADISYKPLQDRMPSHKPVP
ncbi:hypothetical protein AVEN_117514-1 [Araneus ventricosus]|uniref:Uncharacterized protein n=1 Tax=Araneus ventricosus TaxID=182803 RepID=A0A4Y2H2A8_ARAVE|nr:hypothetical protein AVEN_117514-1 [Araneus ventricosus]